MGYVKHNAIIVTSWNVEHLEEAIAKAKELELQPTELVTSKVNGYASFMIAPDGSKEGWTDSDKGDAARAAWIKWAREHEKLYVDWVLLGYGGDSEFPQIEDHCQK